MRKPRVNARLIEIAAKIQKLPDFEEHLEHLSCIYCREWWVKSYGEMEQANRSMHAQLINLRTVQKTTSDFQRGFMDERNSLKSTIEKLNATIVELKRRLRKKVRRK